MPAVPYILVVEDDPMIREVLAGLLADEGYDVELASHGREALQRLRERRPDLIVLDLMMPVMDGWRFRAEQRQLADCSDVPVVVLSAVRDLGEQANRLDAAGAIHKPFELDVALRTIERALRGTAANGAPR
jgi:two-component system chemotaxis response regulator CheY